MELFMKAAGAALIASVHGLALSKQSKDMQILLVIAGCCMVAGIAATFLRPVLELLGQLQAMGNLNSELTGILIRAAGIGLVSELACMICTDSGNASLGKTVQLLGSAAVLYLAIPVFRGLIELIQGILEGV